MPVKSLCISPQYVDVWLHPTSRHCQARLYRAFRVSRPFLWYTVGLERNIELQQKKMPLTRYSTDLERCIQSKESELLPPKWSVVKLSCRGRTTSLKQSILVQYGALECIVILLSKTVDLRKRGRVLASECFHIPSFVELYL